MKSNWWIDLLAMIGIMASVSCAIAEDKNDDIAKKAVEEFNKALNTKKVAEVMKTIDVPFYFHNSGLDDSKEYIQEHWNEVLRGARNYLTLKIKIKEVTTFEKLRQKEWKDLSEEGEKEIVKIEKLLGKDHRILKAEFQFDDGTWEPKIAVRITNGKGIVVGLFR